MTSRQLTYFILVLAIGISFKARSQFLYTLQDITNSNFNTILEEPGTGNFLLSCQNYTPVPGSFSFNIRTRMIKLSPAGQVLSVFPLDTNIVFEDRFIPFANYYYVTGCLRKNISVDSVQFLPAVFKYDLNFDLVKKMVLDSPAVNQQYYGNKMLLKQNRFYVSAVNTDLNNFQEFTKFFKLDLDLNILDSEMIWGAALTDMADYNNRLLISGTGFPQQSAYMQVAEMDTTFVVLSRFNLDSVSFVNQYGPQIVGVELSFANLVQAGANSYYVTGNFQPDQSQAHYEKTVSAIIKNNHEVTHSQIIGRDSIHTYYELEMISTSKRYNCIYSVAVESAMPGDAPPGANRSRMLIHKTDTAGNLAWAGYYGGDRYYFPEAVYATTDSGVVITGMRYDTASPAVVGACEGFVMKLTKQGAREFVGIIDHGKMNHSNYPAYPNPVQDALFFDVPTELNAEIHFYDAYGCEVYRVNHYKNKTAVDVSLFSCGVYNYQLKTQNGNLSSGKFVKR